MHPSIDYTILRGGDRVAYADGGFGIVLLVQSMIFVTARFQPGFEAAAERLVMDTMSAGRVLDASRIGGSDHPLQMVHTHSRRNPGIDNPSCRIVERVSIDASQHEILEWRLRLEHKGAAGGWKGTET